MSGHHTNGAGSDTLDQRIEIARRQLEAAVSAPPPGVDRLEARRAHQRWRRSATVAVAAVVVVLVAAVSLRSDDGDAPVVAGVPETSEPGTADAPSLAPGEVRAMAPSPLSGRSTMAAVWTGDEVLVWGGENPDGPLADGAAYDPATDTWRLLPPSPMSARNAPAVAWTGDRAVFWGGHGAGTGHRDGASYDPVADEWTPIAEAPIASACRPQAVWTGAEVLVIAGFNSGEAAAYDPATDRWRELDPLPGQPLPPNVQAIWTGDELVVRATPPSVGGAMREVVYAYSPAEDRWRALPPVSASGASTLPAWTWTGDRLVRVAQQPGAAIAAYVPGDESWTGIGTWPDDVRGMEVSVWTGTHLLLFGGGDQAWLLDPSTGALHPTPAGGGPRRIQPAAVWADGVLVVWGGFEDLDDGLVLRPVVPPPSQRGTTVPLPTEDPGAGAGGATVAVAGPGDLTGYIDPDEGPTEVNGRLLPVQRVYDADGAHIGWWACSFLPREVVEDADFDPADTCGPAITVEE